MSEKKIKILVVDDEKTHIDTLVGLLGAEYRIVVAKSGRQALKLAQVKPHPDLILLDIVMPEMNGYDVCRQLKADAETQDVPVIFLSALDELENKTRGFETGGVDYVTKPFRGEEVVARVRTHLQIRELRQRLEKENIRFKTLAEAAFEGIVIHKNGQILDVNSEASRLLGAKPDALLGKNLMNRVPDLCRSTIIGESEKPWEGEIQMSSGKPLTVEIRTKNMAVESSPVSVTAIRDVSVQRRVELENLALQNENRALKNGMRERYKFGDIIGRSPAMQSVYELVAQAGASDFHVVIYGESGTGKELVARTICKLSHRRSEAFVAVNCGAISESLFEREFFGHRKGGFTSADQNQPGFFEAAHKGTLFLDELGELKPAMQVKLLRVLENGEYIPVGGVQARKADVRIISATNKDLPALLAQGKFREDFFYRVHVIEIALPPLRDRKEDIPLLIDHFMASLPSNQKQPRLPAKIMEALCHYDWPGNVRELQNTIQRFAATNQFALPGDRSPALETNDASENSYDFNSAVEALEQKLIRNCLQKTQWHRGKAADMLNIPRRTLQRKMVKYGFRGPEGI